MNNKEIGGRIKYARDLRDVTLDDIASKVGVAKSTIQRYECGKIRTLKIPVLQSIAYSLNVNPSWLVGKSDEMEIKQDTTPKIMEYYNKLNSTGQQEAEKRVEELTYISRYTVDTPVIDYFATAAAHERTDIAVSEADRKADDDIMNNDNF